jgi:hypothetical protein
LGKLRRENRSTSKHELWRDLGELSNGKTGA